MKKILENKYLNLFARLIVGGLFLYSGIGKIADPELFSQQISNYNILPDFGILITSMSLPWVEVIAGLLLILGVRQKANSLLISFMLLIFIIAISIAMLQGLSIDCGCQSSFKAQKVGFPKIFENIGFLFVSIYLYFFPNGKLSFENMMNGE